MWSLVAKILVFKIIAPSLISVLGFSSWLCKHRVSNEFSPQRLVPMYATQEHTVTEATLVKKVTPYTTKCKNALLYEYSDRDMYVSYIQRYRD